MEHTTTYQLTQWVAEDHIKRDDFNADNAKLEAALTAHDAALALKADASDLTALTTRVGNLETGKADNTALSAEATARQNAVSAEATARASADSAEATARQSADTTLQGNIDAETAAREAALAAVNANLGSHGHNLRIASGSYSGSGKYGSDNANSITFDFYPMIVFVIPSNGGSNVSATVFYRGLEETMYARLGTYTLDTTWTDNGLSWYSAVKAEYQLNSAFSGYLYFALGYDKAAEDASE